MTKEQYVELIEKHPELTAHGYGISVDLRLAYTEEEKKAIWEDARMELLHAWKEFEYCCEWIDGNPDLHGKRTSYHWKHQVEFWLRSNGVKPDYIAEGVFTLAAIYKGYKVHRIRKSDGARIGERIA